MRKNLYRMVLSGLLSAPLADTVVAQSALSGIDSLPASVKAVYLRICEADSWIGNKRILRGSTSKTLSDGAQVFLMVCGDAASTVPFAAIVFYPTGEATEAHFQWRFQGKNLEAQLGDARFGAQPDTVVSHSHSSAQCNPTYTHRWDGATFQLVAYSGKGCDDNN